MAEARSERRKNVLYGRSVNAPATILANALLAEAHIASLAIRRYFFSGRATLDKSLTFLDLAPITGEHGLIFEFFERRRCCAASKNHHKNQYPYTFHLSSLRALLRLLTTLLILDEAEPLR